MQLHGRLRWPLWQSYARRLSLASTVLMACAMAARTLHYRFQSTSCTWNAACLSVLVLTRRNTAAVTSAFALIRPAARGDDNVRCKYSLPSCAHAVGMSFHAAASATCALITLRQWPVDREFKGAATLHECGLRRSQDQPSLCSTIEGQWMLHEETYEQVGRATQRAYCLLLRGD